MDEVSEFAGVPLYKPEAKFHELLNQVNKIEAPMLATALGVEMYLLAYGLHEGHVWGAAASSQQEDGPYHSFYRQYLDLYRRLNVISLGMSFYQFMGLTKTEMNAVIDSLTKPEPPPEG